MLALGSTITESGFKYKQSNSDKERGLPLTPENISLISIDPVSETLNNKSDNSQLPTYSVLEPSSPFQDNMKSSSSYIPKSKLKPLRFEEGYSSETSSSTKIPPEKDEEIMEIDFPYNDQSISKNSYSMPYEDLHNHQPMVYNTLDYQSNPTSSPQGINPSSSHLPYPFQQNDPHHLIWPSHILPGEQPEPLLIQYQGNQNFHSNQGPILSYSHSTNQPHQSNVSFSSDNFLETAPYRSHHYQKSATSTLSTISAGPSIGHRRHSSVSTVNTTNEETVIEKPLISTVYWDDKNTICYQVEVSGVLVSRREDNSYVNGTKLLNAAGLSRGKRDGMLKLERQKSIVKVGSMNLKGVWIPLERAREIARNQRLDRPLFPLLRRDLKEYFSREGVNLKRDQALDVESL